MNGTYINFFLFFLLTLSMQLWWRGRGSLSYTLKISLLQLKKFNCCQQTVTVLRSSSSYFYCMFSQPSNFQAPSQCRTEETRWRRWSSTSTAVKLTVRDDSGRLDTLVLGLLNLINFSIEFSALEDLAINMIRKGHFSLSDRNRLLMLPPGYEAMSRSFKLKPNHNITGLM